MAAAIEDPQVTVKILAHLGWYGTFIENADYPKGGTGLWPYINANIFSDPILERPEFVEMRSRLEIIE